MSGSMPVEDICARLIGAWDLICWREIRPDGGVDYPLGEDALGKLLYTEDGHVSAQLARRRLRRFRKDDWREAAEAERAGAWKDYFGYFGTYSIDHERHAVIHHVEGAWFPNLAGTDQVRGYRFEDDRLVLNADTAWGRVEIVWKRSVPA